MNTTQLTATDLLIIDCYNLDLTIDAYFDCYDEDCWAELAAYSDATLAQLAADHPGTSAGCAAVIILDERADELAA